MVLDACGECGGDGSSCAGCDDKPNSGLVFDSCGLCGGTDTHCLDSYTLSSTGGCLGAASAAVARVGWTAPSNHSALALRITSDGITP